MEGWNDGFVEVLNKIEDSNKGFAEGWSKTDISATLTFPGSIGTGSIGATLAFLGNVVGNRSISATLTFLGNRAGNGMISAFLS
eukprot:875656-Ditylum_brightwellii.AAC.1